MPGRFTSDTNSRSLLVSRSTWTTTMVDTCYPVAVLTGTASVLGVASFSSSGGTFAAAAPRATDGIILNQTVASGIDNVLTFDVAKLEESDEEGVLVTVLETIDNVPYVIGGGRLRQGKDQRISFRATGNNIQVVLNGPYSAFILNQVCTRYARSTAQTYLVEVCDESKDKYRFGFNGQEKVNEISGVGNSLDFGARMYDSRIGRFLSIDPRIQEYPWQTSYCFSDNRPILFVDIEGEGTGIPATLKLFLTNPTAALKGLDTKSLEIAVRGAADAIANANSLGVYDYFGGDNTSDYNSIDDQISYNLGRFAGSTFSVASGNAEVSGGSSVAAGGAVASGTGVGAIVGVPAAALGGVVAVHGSAVVATAITDVAESIVTLTKLFASKNELKRKSQSTSSSSSNNGKQASGGGKNSQKINQKRAESWSEKETRYRTELKQAKTKSQKKEIQTQIDHAVKKQRPSENHGNSGKR